MKPPKTGMSDKQSDKHCSATFNSDDGWRCACKPDAHPLTCEAFKAEYMPSAERGIADFIAAQEPMDADLAQAARAACDQMLREAPSASAPSHEQRTYYANPQQLPDRGEAVNLARNWLDGQSPRSGFHITTKGIRALAEAVLLMDAWILEVTNNALPSSIARMKAVPYDDILGQIDHIKQNGIDLAKFGGQDVDEGRCRELCAMYLREFITSEEMRQRLIELDAAESAPSAIAPSADCPSRKICAARHQQHLQDLERLDAAQSATLSTFDIPEGWELYCEKCGSDRNGPCGWPSNCPTGLGSSESTKQGGA